MKITERYNTTRTDIVLRGTAIAIISALTGALVALRLLEASL